MFEKQILIIGGTGAIGTYTIEELVKLGYQMDVITLDPLESTNQIHYICRNFNDGIVDEILKEKYYDAIIDFRHHDPRNYPPILEQLAEHTQHLIYLSSYRVYADTEVPIRESSPRWIDVMDDDTLNTFKKKNEYSVQKGCCEEIIRSSKYADKVTIVRPLIAFYHGRLSYITCRASIVVARTMNHKKIIVPEAAKNITAGYCFSGNVGKQLAHLVLNPKAYGEAYTLGTDENLTWGTIGEYMTELFGAEFIWTDMQSYLDNGVSDPAADLIGLNYDRLVNRQMDISKVLSVTDLRRSDLMNTYDALKQEIRIIRNNPNIYDRMIQEYDKALDEKMDSFIRSLR